MNIKILFIAFALTTICSAFANYGQHVKVEKVSYHDAKSQSLINVVKVPGAATKYMLTFGCKEKNMVKVKILDSEGNPIFEDQHIMDGTVGFVYTVERSDVYTFVVTDKNGDPHLFMD